MHKEEFRKFSNVPYLLAFFKVTSFCDSKVLSVLDPKRSVGLFVQAKRHLILKLNNMLRGKGEGQKSIPRILSVFF